MAIGWFVFFCLFVLHWIWTGAFPLQTTDDLRGFLRAIGSSIAVIALTSFYAGIGGAVVMGIAALFRKFRLRSSTET